jgi:hypothetical protein
MGVRSTPLAHYKMRGGKGRDDKALLLKGDILYSPCQEKKIKFAIIES